MTAESDEASTSRRVLMTGLAGLVGAGLAATALAPDEAEAATKVAASSNNYVSGFDISRYIKGNGIANDTAGFKRAVAAAIAKKAHAILIPAGKRVFVSAPIDLKGLSVVGYGATVIASTTTKPAGWRLGPTFHGNDVAVFYAIGHSNWSVVGLTIDCQNAFCKGLTAWGGDYITFLHVTVKNSASAALQMMGAGRAGIDKPIRYGRMIGCTVDRGRWSFVLDGQHIGTQIVGCTSTNCLNSHISVDPNAAVDPANQFARGLVIVGNSLTGAISNPANWYSTGGDTANEAGIRLRYSPITATVSGNSVYNWPTVGIEAHEVSGTIVGNIIANDTLGTTGIELRNNTALLVGSNEIVNYGVGVDVDASVADTRVMPQGFSGVVTRYALAATLQPTVQIDDAAYRAPGGVFSSEPAGTKALRAATAQTVTSGALTTVVFDTESYDDMGIFDLAASPDRFMISRPGRYDVNINLTFDVHGSGYREVRLVDASSGVPVARAQMPGLTGVATTVALSTELAVTATPRVLQAQAFQNCGSDLAVLAQTFPASISIRKTA